MKKLSWPHRCWREWSKIINAFSVVISLVVVMMIARPVCAAERQVVHVHMPAAAARLQPLGPMGSSQPLNLAIGLPLRNQEVLNQLLQQIYDPASPNYHHFLTPEQFTERFGPTEQDYQAVIAFARANGLTVTAEHPNRLLVDVSGSVADIERVLHVRMQVYQHPTENRTFYAPDVEPSLDLAVPILSISGLNNYSLPRPRLKNIERVSGQTVVPNAGSGPGGTYMGKDFRAAYAPDTTLGGSGQVVGLLQFDGYAASDITYYESQAGLPSVTLSNVLIDGASGLPSGSGGEVEVSLDIEMVISMATNVSQVIVYEAPNPSPFVDILNRMATDNLAKQLSCSWYVPNGPAEPAAEQIWQEMAAQGQSFFNASGDNDAYTGLIDFPGDSTNITQVGGTTLTTSGAGGAWASETVWNWGNGIGSGGGISTQYPIPYWQTNINMTANQGSTIMRNTPDVALTADKVYVRADGNNYNVGGTSCAAPLWAGFAALVNQQAAATGEPAVGFINPAVDAIGSGPNYATCFHDITTGNNTSSSSPTKFYAVTGYDLCTGWGTPNGQKLINALANPEALQIIPTTGFTSMGGVGGPFAVTTQSFSLTNVGTNSLTWTLSNTSLWLNASSSGGALARGGPATNVMISLNSVASNLLVGTYQATVWFTNLNDRVGQSRQFTLAVLSPPAITQQPTDQAVLDGATMTFTVEATGGQPLYYQWQYNSNNLTDGGNISGSTTTNLTINNASLANVGYYDLIVSNAAGVVVSTNALLTIVPSRPVIIQQPADETVVVKGTAQFTVAALGTKPFSYQWSFNETNIDGATNATLVLTNVQFDQAGAYAVVITNIHGSTLSSNANLTVIPCDPDPPGLLSWWAGEDNANDQIGTNNGAWFGNTTYGPGEVGEGFVFDGNGSGVRIANAMNLQLQDLTIETWIRRSSSSVVSYGSGGNGVIFGYGMGGYLFFMNSVGSLIFGQLGNPAYLTGPAIMDTNWHHVAVTKVGSVIVFYLDGVAYATPAYSVTFTFTTSVGIGYRPDNGDNGFLGTIDEMSVYDRVLSATEIQSIYLAGSGGKCFTPEPPVITTQPTNQTVVAGQTAMFSVTVTGTQPLSYQWTFDTTNIVAGTNATLVLTNVQPGETGTYAVVVSNLVDAVLSSNATLTVNPAPPCDPAPSGLVSWWKAEGNALDAVGTNNGTLVGSVSYGPGEVGQGFVFDGNGSGVRIANATNLQLQDLTTEAWIRRSSSSVVSHGSGGNGVIFGYGTGGYLFFMNSVGSLIFGQLGNPAYLTGPAIMDTNWHHVAVTKVGSVIIFYLDGVAYPVSAYNVTFTFTTSVGIGYRPDNGDNGFLGTIDEMSVYNRVLSATEIQSIYLAGSGGKCFTPEPPVITTQPTNQTVMVGQTAMFSVTATGTQPLSYQWMFDTTNIAAGTNVTLVLTNVQFSQAGTYAVVVSNLVDSVLSSNATLTVLAPPSIITQPTNQTVYVGGTASFSVTASGTLPFSYQWNFNQTNIVSATNATLILTNVLPNQAGTYAVLVANPVSSILSSNAVLTVNPPPTLGVTTSGGFVLIFWPVSMPGFVLETSSSLSPANWVPVPNPPIQIGNEYLESIQMTGTNQFFRLQLGE